MAAVQDHTQQKMVATSEIDQEMPLSPINLDDGSVEDGDPAVLEVSTRPQNNPTTPLGALDSPFRIQGSMEAGHQIDYWEFYNTQDQLNVCTTDDENVIYMPGTSVKRYYPALRNLYPVRKEQPKDRRVLPVDSVGFFSFATFAWMSGFMWRLFRRGAFSFEAYRCSLMESCTLNGQRFEYLWQEELKERGADESSLYRVSWRFVRTRVIVNTIVYSIAILGGFITPMVFLPWLVDIARRQHPSHVIGAVLAFSILGVDAVRALLTSLNSAMYIRTGLRLRSAILALLYRKIVNLNNLGSLSHGQVINFFSNDSARIFEFGQLMHMWVAGGLTVLVSFVWIIWELQLAGLAGVGAYIIFFVLQYLLTTSTARFRAQAVVCTDRRVNQTKEALASIKVIKLNAWEDAFHRSIASTRNQELGFLQKLVFFHMMSTAISNSLPPGAAIVTFMACFAMGYPLTAAQGFATLSILMWSRYGLIFLPVSLGAIAQVKSTMVRVKDVLLQADTRPCISKPKDLSHMVCLTNATLAWDLPSEEPQGPITVTGHNNKGLVTPINNRKGLGNDEPGTVTATLIDEPGTPRVLEVLHDVNFAVPKGRFVCICGGFASGKSSILSAILGQMHLIRGDLSMRGTLAYVATQPWLIKATVRENIVFGDAFDPKRYYSAIRCCALNEDLHALPGGDQTEVADAGATLSGGQQQRVALARAVYADRDVYLLDDPLACLDGQVADEVFRTCLRGALAGKTVILACSQPRFLKQADHVVVMRHGRIVEQGSPAELLETGAFYPDILASAKDPLDYVSSSNMKNGTLPRNPVLSVDHNTNTVHNAVAVAPNSVEPSLTSLAEAARLTRPEEKGEGSIKWQTYLDYAQAMGGVWVVIGIMLSALAFVLFTVFGSWYLSMVLKSLSENTGLSTHHHNYQPNDNVTFNATFAALVNDIAANASITEGSVDDVVVNSTPDSHAVETDHTLELPGGTSFFGNNTNMYDDAHMEQGGSGRSMTIHLLVFGVVFMGMFITAVLQAFLFSRATTAASRSLHDGILHKIFHSTMRFFDTTPIGRILNLFSKDLDEVDFMLATFFNVCSTLVWSCALGLLMVIAVYPMFLAFLVVISLVFAYSVLLFRTTAREVKRRENISRSPLYSHINATCVGLPMLHAHEKEKMFEKEFIRLQDDNSALNYLLIGSIRWLSFRLDLIVALATSFVALLIVFMHGYVDPAFAALALVYCSNMAGIFNYTVRVTTETQARLTNVERIMRYKRSLEYEGPDKNAVPPVVRDWPSRGKIQFDDVDLQYRENLPLALERVSFVAEAGQKVALVGRTGAGKSSVGAALFRLVEVQRGRISIDDVDLARIPVSELRSRMSIIPQDPVLFNGTLRFNLDPLNHHHDEEIWQALAKIQLQDKVTSLDKQLSFSVKESGENFSTGEKQLLCLARAVLRQSRIVLLDEATSTVDNVTSDLLHELLMESFADCTVLSIVHRLQHVMDYDMVIVIKKGKVAEMGDPKTLASNQTSLFAKMLAAEKPTVDAKT